MSNSFLESLEANTDVSIARRVKRRLPDIEAALVHGYTHREILAQLNRDGIKITDKYYQRLIPRLRNQVKAQVAKAALQQPPEKPAQPRPSFPKKIVTHGIGANNPQFSLGIAPTPGNPPSIISEPNPEPIPFTWDPHAAKNYSIDKL